MSAEAGAGALSMYGIAVTAGNAAQRPPLGFPAPAPMFGGVAGGVQPLSLNRFTSLATSLFPLPHFPSFTLSEQLQAIARQQRDILFPHHPAPVPVQQQVVSPQQMAFYHLIQQQMAIAPSIGTEMVDCSIGDRVEVQLGAKPFAAKVIRVHSAGIVDVMYDVDGSVGVYVTAQEHGLKLLGDEEKKGGEEKKKVPSVDGCSSIIECKGLCNTHSRKPCSVDGCSTTAYARGLCNKHGAKGDECLREGCTIAAAKKGRKQGRLCSKHTVKLSCADPDCDTPQISGKFVCFKHGAFGYCTTDECISNAIGTRGKCTKHDSKTVACSAEGCSNIAVARGLCSKHGSKGFCSYNKCTSAVQSRGRCKKHGGGSRKVCTEEGCATFAQARGLCKKHGARGTCKCEGCNTNVNSRPTHCATAAVNRKGQFCTKHGGTSYSEGVVDAKVIVAHSSGKEGVTYDIDGSVGIFLAAKEHGVTLLGNGETKGGGKKKKVCVVDGCPCVGTYKGQLCKKHGGKMKVCVMDGCLSIGGYKGQLCKKHGGKPCSVDGCTTNARARGLCYNHGALGRCLLGDCTTIATKKGRFCYKHTVKVSCAKDEFPSSTTDRLQPVLQPVN